VNPRERNGVATVARMKDDRLESRRTALSLRSSYVENVLRHALVAGLAGELWRRDSACSLQVFNAEVDDAGFDVVLGLGSQNRYLQLKQTYAAKVPAFVSVRVAFAGVPGACVVLMSHSLDDLSLAAFRFYGGRDPSMPMPPIEAFAVTKSSGRRSADGVRKLRGNYRNVPVRRFGGPIGLPGLLDALFPGATAP
jgi:hypothetical protein